MNGRVLLLAAGVALVLLTSGFMNELLGPSRAVFNPDTSLFLIARWSGRGLTAVGVALLAWSFLQAKLPRAEASTGYTAQLPARASKPAGRSLAAEASEAERRSSFLAAAELFDRAGDIASAARCYASALAENVRGSREHGRLLQLAVNRFWASGGHDQATALAIEHGDLKLAADLRGKAGDVRGQAELLARTSSGLVSAVEVLTRAGDRQGAAKLLMSKGDLQGAIDLMTQEDPRVAARFCEQEGQPLLAASLYEQAGDLEAAAALFKLHGNPVRAGEILVKLGDLEAAAVLLEEGGAFKQAAELKIELGDLDGAGQLFKKAGEPTGLGKRLEARGDLLGAARGYSQGGNPEDALRVLSALPPATQQEPKNRLLMAALLLRVGKPEKIISLLRPMVQDPKIGATDRAESYYALGLAYQATGDLPQAVAAMEVVATIDAKHRDVALRLAELRSLSAKAAAKAAAVPTPANELPRLPARYKIEAKVGEGAMGLVYRATDSVLGRSVAIKVLSKELAESEKARTYFLREARAAAGLSHPNIVTLFDAGVEEAQPYLVMEFLSGVNLETETLGKPLPEKRALGYALQIADALAYVHARNIVHRDVKPANVMRVEGTDTVKLMDFGIAHLTETGKKSTIVAGTPDFMAPEQLLGRGLGAWTDVYALGGTLFQFLTGQVAYPEGGPDTDVPDPRSLVPGLSPKVAQLVMDCLAKDPKARPQSAGEVRSRLAALFA